jgi:hypothetical protein
LSAERERILRSLLSMLSSNNHWLEFCKIFNSTI